MAATQLNRIASDQWGRRRTPEPRQLGLAFEKQPAQHRARLLVRLILQQRPIAGNVPAGDERHLVHGRSPIVQSDHNPPRPATWGSSEYTYAATNSGAPAGSRPMVGRRARRHS